METYDNSIKPFEPIFVKNAGIVILGPYIHALFSRLNLFKDDKFKDNNAIHKAIFLLHYAIYEKTTAEENELILNKILCGYPMDKPLPNSYELEQSEKDMVNDLLRAIIKQWSALNNTSIRGLQESFLQREGKLSRSKEGWELIVEKKSFDILLDQLPWSISVIKNQQMADVIYTEWR